MKKVYFLALMVGAIIGWFGQPLLVRAAFAQGNGGHNSTTGYQLPRQSDLWNYRLSEFDSQLNGYHLHIIADGTGRLPVLTHSATPSQYIEVWKQTSSGQWQLYTWALSYGQGDQFGALLTQGEYLVIYPSSHTEVALVGYWASP